MGGDFKPGYSGSFQRLRQILFPEQRELWMILLYGAIVSLFSLAVPVAVQSLVNSVAYGQLTQQLVLLSIVVFLVLSFSGFFSVLQYYAVELLQRRLFIRYSMDLAVRLPRVVPSDIRHRLGAEFVNPFLEVVTLHKSLSHLLLGGLALLLQILVGVILLGAYHPILMIFSIVLILTISCIFFLLGWGGVSSADAECSAKYSVLAWLEDMARMPMMFHSNQGESFGLIEADNRVHSWLEARRRHFRILFRQNISMHVTHAIASALLLGIGGVLVIKGQLSLGQIVAAELVLNVALSGLAKFGKHLENYYDLMAACQKLDSLRAVPLEVEGAEAVPDSEVDAARLEIRELSVKFVDAHEPILDNVNLLLEPGDCVALYGQSSSGKTIMLDCIYGLITSYLGQIRLDGFDLQDLTRSSLRTRVGLVGEPEFFHATLEDNLKAHARGVSNKELREVLDSIGLDKAVARLPQGLQSVMYPKSGLFSSSELIRFAVARTVLARPGLMLVDQGLDGIDDETLQGILKVLLAEDRSWTLLLATNQSHVAQKFPRAFELKNGQLRPFKNRGVAVTSTPKAGRS